MSNVREVVLEAMRENGLGGHESRASGVINTLVERDEEIATTLINEGVEMGANADALRDLMIGVGLLPPRLTMVQESNGHGEGTENDEVLNLLRGIRSDIDGLTRFARANGYTG